MADACDSGYEPSVSINLGEFLDCLRTYQRLRNSSAVCSWFVLGHLSNSPAK